MGDLRSAPPPLRTALQGIVAVGAGGAAGAVFWPLANQNLGIAAAMVGFFALGRLARFVAFLFALSFHLSMSADLRFIAEKHMDLTGMEATITWLIGSLLASAPALVLRGRAPGLRATIAALIYILPPVGPLVGSTPPLSVGALFPGLGIYGLAAWLSLVWMIACFRPTQASSTAGVVALLLCAAGANLRVAVEPPPAPPSNWHAYSTEVGEPSHDLSKRMDLANLGLPRQIASSSNVSAGQILFLPEGMIYDWKEGVRFLWKIALEKRNVTAVVGIYRPVDPELQGGWLSAVRVLGARTDLKGVDDLEDLSASMTMPVAMWRPWLPPGHFPAHLPNPVVTLDGSPLHISWCYESTVLWPHLRAAMRTGQLTMVSIENRWSTKGTNAEPIQSVSARLVARWLGAALLEPVNH